LSTASSLYGAQRFAKVDAHTLTCDADSAHVTYLPIPAGSLSHYAGLMTLDVPSPVAARGCTMTARQITNAITLRGAELRFPQRRKVLGTFQINVPIETTQDLLGPEERLYAFFQWILSILSSGDRWYPVIERYVCEIALRVKIFGGDPNGIAPFPGGAVPGRPVHPGRGGGHPVRGGGHPGDSGHSPTCDQIERTGKIEGLEFDRFGDFDSFILHVDTGAKTVYYARERHLAELARWAWQAQYRVTVFSSTQHPNRPDRIILHTPQI
jgi:hypothetical protein